MRPHALLSAVALVLASAAVACGSSSDGSAPSDPSVATEESDVGTAKRLKDIRTATRFFRHHGAQPSAAYVVGARTLFFAKTGATRSMRPTYEEGLFATDGTPAGTSRVAKLDAAPWGTPAVHDGHLYFITSKHVAGPAVYEYRLNVSDGTAAGTTVIALPGQASRVLASAKGLFAVTVEATANGAKTRLLSISRAPNGDHAVDVLREVEGTEKMPWPYLSANDDFALLSVGGTIVVTDGTGAGTTDVATGRKVSSIYATNGRLFFVEPSPSVSGASELFEILGPDASPRVRGYGPLHVEGDREAPSYVHSVAHLDDKPVLFTASGMYTVDVLAGTVARFKHAFPKDRPLPTAVAGGKLYALDADTGLVETDGTLAGTRAIARPSSTPSWSDAKATELVTHDGKLFYVGVAADAARQIFAYTPSTGQRTQVSTLPNGAKIENLRSVGTKLFFSTGSEHKEMWSWDGTDFRMLEVNPYGNASSDAAPVAATTDHVFFLEREDVEWTARRTGPYHTLWATTGTTAGTVALRKGDYSFFASRITTPAAATAGPRMCILEQSPANVRLVVCTDGTAAGTTEHALGAELAPVTFGNAILFVRRAGDRPELVSLDGATGAVTSLATLAPGAQVTRIVPRDADFMFFVASSDAASRGVWTSNGSAAGTIRMVPNVTFADSRHELLGRVGNVAFVAIPESYQTSVYRTDGTATGTAKVGEIAKELGSYVRAGVTGGKVVLPHAESLYAIDATGVTEIAPRTKRASEPTPLEDGRLAFVGDDGVVLTDGTAAGTQFLPVPKPSHIAVLPGKGLVVTSYDTKRLFLVAGGALQELEAGRPVAANYRPVLVNGALLFPGDVDGKGMELLATDGTPGGTRVVTEILPGAAASDPQRPLVGLGKIFFNAIDAQGDRELYSLPVTAVP